jgi:hypothetical protein
VLDRKGKHDDDDSYLLANSIFRTLSSGFNAIIETLAKLPAQISGLPFVYVFKDGKQVFP